LSATEVPIDWIVVVWDEIEERVVLSIVSIIGIVEGVVKAVVVVVEVVIMESALSLNRVNKVELAVVVLEENISSNI